MTAATHSWTIDGLEEDTARVEEDGTRMITVPRYLLPANAKEGQIFRVTRTPSRVDSSLVITVSPDAPATAAALAKSKATVKAASAASRKRDPGGDVAL